MNVHSIIAKRVLALAAFAAVSAFATALPVDARSTPLYRGNNYNSGVLTGKVGTIDSKHHWIELRSGRRIYAIDCNNARMYLDGQKLSFSKATRNLPSYATMSVVPDHIDAAHKVKAGVVRISTGGGGYRNGDRYNPDRK